MSQDFPIILYIGDSQAGQALHTAVQANDWTVYVPTDVMEALGVYITYCPDLVIIEPTVTSEFAKQVHYHLQTVDADPMILLEQSHYSLSSDSLISLIMDVLNLHNETANAM
ncbi:MAG: hypothetical protein ABI947_14760 [Chloroflexota bacterium]